MSRKLGPHAAHCRDHALWQPLPPAEPQHGSTVTVTALAPQIVLPALGDWGFAHPLSVRATVRWRAIASYAGTVMVPAEFLSAAADQNRIRIHVWNGG